MTLKVFFIGFIILSFSCFGASNSPSERLDEFIKYIKEITRPEPGQTLKGEEIKKNKELSKKAITFIDVAAIAQRSLGDYWKKLNSGKQNEFVNLLKRLVVLNAFPRSKRFFGRVTYTNQPQKLEGTKATIRQLVVYKGDSETPQDSKLTVDYTLEKRGSNWVMVNLSFDEVELLASYKNQFSSLINKDGYDKLLNLMQNKRKDLEEEFGKMLPE